MKDEARSTECQRETRGGGSAKGSARGAGGGGYPDICTALKGGSERAALADLPPEIALLPEPWQSVARAVGWDQWCVIWGILLRSDRLDDRRRPPKVNHPIHALRWGRAKVIDMVADSSRADCVSLVQAAFGDEWAEKTIQECVGPS